MYNFAFKYVYWNEEILIATRQEIYFIVSVDKL